MQRLYFLLPDVESTRQLIGELEGYGVPHRRIHVVAAQGTNLEDLPRATFIHESEFKHEVGVGLGLGGTAGLIGGLLAATFPPAEVVLGGAALLASTVAGAGFGALVTGLLGKDTPAHEQRALRKAIHAGRLLMLVDVPRRDVDRTIELIKGHHPEAEIGVKTPPEQTA